MDATMHFRNPRFVQFFVRSFSLWSMKKDPCLESALTKNRRWMVNNQIKNIILRCPDQVATVRFIQKKFKTLDLQGNALNWLNKYPCCFQVYLQGHEYYCQLTKRMMSLVEEEGTEPCFTCSLPSTWVKSWERFHEFNATPYISPYLDSKGLVEGSNEMEKRTVGLVHELLSFTLWKKASIAKLGHFQREFVLPQRLNVFLLKHPGIFYVSNKYQIYTVLLREGYDGQELVDQDPLVVVKEKFGELMQEGLHEYNRRRPLVNLEKKKKKGLVLSGPNEGKDRSSEMSDPEDQGDRGGLFDPEERKRFYKVLFDDGAP